MLKPILSKSAHLLFLLGAVAHAQDLKIEKDLIFRTSTGIGISNLLISNESGSRKGAQILQTENERRESGSGGFVARYIGFDLKAVSSGEGDFRIPNGRYKNQGAGYVDNKISFSIGPWSWSSRSEGSAGIGALVLLGTDMLQEQERDNGFITVAKDRENPEAKEEVKVQPTRYRDGYCNLMVVEFAFESLQDLINHRTSAVEGRVRYYRRGAFDALVYSSLVAKDEPRSWPSADLPKEMASLMGEFQSGHLRTHVALTLDPRTDASAHRILVQIQ